MILNKQESQTIETNQSSNGAIKAEIHDSRLIIDYLRNKMYGNKIQTPIQEYISNAIDAMEGVSSRPIEITLPTGIKQEWKCRDFGNGLSKDEMVRVFTQYGNSTKVGKDNQVGGYGLGSKSAWAYSPVFFVSLFKDGLKSIYMARINELNDGEFILSAEIKTEEPNGLEITIPVLTNDIQSFIFGTYRACLFRKNKPKILDQEERWNELYEFIEKPFLESKTGGFKFYSRNSLLESVVQNYSNSTIVCVNGVPYVLPQSLSSHSVLKQSNSLCIVEFSTSEVLIQTDRERISEDENTVNNIIQRLKLVKKEIDLLRIRKNNKNYQNLSEFVVALNADLNSFSSRYVISNNKDNNRNNGNNGQLPVPTFKNDKFDIKVDLNGYYSSTYSLIFKNSIIKDNDLFLDKRKFKSIISYRMKGTKLIVSNNSIQNKITFEGKFHWANVYRLTLKVNKNNGKFEGHFIIVDETLSDTMLHRKMKRCSTNLGEVHCIEKSLYEYMGESLFDKVTKISSIELPKNQRKEKDDNINLKRYYYSNYGVKATPLVLSQSYLDKKILYFVTEGNKNPDWFNDKDKVLKFCSSYGYELYSISASNEKELVNYPNFIKIETLIKEKMGSDYCKLSVASKHSELNILKLIDADFEDISPEFNKVVKLMKCKNVEIPDGIISMSQEQLDLMKVLDQEIKDVCLFVLKELPLLSLINIYSWSTKSAITDISIYIKAKLMECKEKCPKIS